MSLKTLYEKFLARPEQDLLAPNATLNYITTTTTFTGAEAVVKHLHSQNRVVTKKAEKVLSTVEGRNSLCLDVELTAQFVSGGGSYLLSLDENFLIDLVVTFPLVGALSTALENDSIPRVVSLTKHYCVYLQVHIVQFDSENKISQIRLYWDQGSLLKQVDVIGSHHRNWPIRDGAEQVRLVNSSVQSVASTEPEPAVKPSHDRGSDAGETAVPTRSPEKKSGHGPQASLSLFETLSMDDDQPKPARGPARGSAKPPPRDLNELFVGDDGDTTPTKATAASSKKGADEHPIRSRGGTDAGEENVMQTPKTVSKNYGHFEFGEPDAPASAPTPSTTSKKHDHFEFGEAAVTESPKKPVTSKHYDHFEFGQDEPQPVAPPKNVHQHFEFGEVESEPVAQPKKINDHFEFGGDEPQPAPVAPRSSKHMPQWDFEDFASPQKQPQKPRPQEVRHFGWSDDENDQADSPQKQPRTHQPRRDAASHFAFEDQETAAPDTDQKPQRTLGGTHNKGLGLYDNNLYDESGAPPAETEPKSHQSMAVNAAHRHKDFDSHWVMTDEPALDVKPEKEENKNLSGDKMKAVKMMDSNWEMNDDDAANPHAVAVPPKPQRMSRDVNQRSWGFGDDYM